MEKIAFEETVNDLLLLAEKKPLKGRDREKAKTLMLKLREAGYTNRMISDLANGAWREPTVKLYTRGAKTKNSTSKEYVTQLIGQLFTKDFTLTDFENALVFKMKLEDERVNLKEVGLLFEETKQFNVDLKSLLQMHLDLKSGLKINQLGEALSYRSQLEAMGYTLNEMGQLYKTTMAFGGLNKTLTALNTYKSLQNLETVVRKKSMENERLVIQVRELNSKVTELMEKEKSIEGTLKLHQQLNRLGFNEQTLKELKKIL